MKDFKVMKCFRPDFKAFRPDIMDLRLDFKVFQARFHEFQGFQGFYDGYEIFQIGFQVICTQDFRITLLLNFLLKWLGLFNERSRPMCYSTFTFISKTSHLFFCSLTTFLQVYPCWDNYFAPECLERAIMKGVCHSSISLVRNHRLKHSSFLSKDLWFSSRLASLTFNYLHMSIFVWQFGTTSHVPSGLSQHMLAAAPTNFALAYESPNILR